MEEERKRGDRDRERESQLPVKETLPGMKTTDGDGFVPSHCRLLPFLCFKKKGKTKEKEEEGTKTNWTKMNSFA